MTNSRLHIPRIRPARQNQKWIISSSRWINRQRVRIEHFLRLRRSGLHLRAAFWCAWNTR